MEYLLMSASSRVAAMVTAFQRPDQTIHTLSRISACVPPPSEILIHVDGGNQALAELITKKFPFARVFISSDNIGPGASRNVLLRESCSEFCASFDDESFPVYP